MSAQPFARAGQRTIGLTWGDRLDMADSVREVLDIVRVYLARFAPEEIAAMPGKCRPRKLMDANELSEYALDLVRETCLGEPPDSTIAKLASVISHAAVRAAELAACTNDA